MKTKIIIDISKNKKHPENLDITYTRRDLEKPDTKDEALILLYIEGLVRATIDGGFSPAGIKRNEDGGNTKK